MQEYREPRPGISTTLITMTTHLLQLLIQLRLSSKIAAALTKISSKQDDDEAEVSTDNSKCMNLQERMSLWERNENLENIALDEELDGLYPKDVDSQVRDFDTRAWDEDEEVSDSRLRAYRSFIPSTEAYEWLLTRLRREYCLVPTEPKTMQEIRATILSSLPVNRTISRKMSSRSLSARFELNWDIIEFLEIEGYSGRPDEVFEGVITLTGSCHDAQAATCAQYIRQTWPLTGDAMVQLIRKVLQGGEGHSSMCKRLGLRGFTAAKNL